jgi:hypothetical protein
MARNNPWECKLTVLPDRVGKGETVNLTVTLSVLVQGVKYDIPENDSFYTALDYTYSCPNNPTLDNALPTATDNHAHISDFPELLDGAYQIDVKVAPKSHSSVTSALAALVSTIAPTSVALPTFQTTKGFATIRVATHKQKVDATLQRTAAHPLSDSGLWPAIHNRTAAIGFERYQKFINCIFCEDGFGESATTFIEGGVKTIAGKCVDKGVEPKLNIYGPYAYNVLKVATQAFLMLESGVVIRDDRHHSKIFDLEKESIRLNDPDISFDEINARLGQYLVPVGGHEQILPYLKRIVTNLITLDDKDIQEVLPYCEGILRHRFTSPSLMELIWSYWHEEGMLVQTMHAIARRFQNRAGSARDPLGELEFDPLRPLNNLIWGFIQDEYSRLTVPRRAHEYQHHYGLSLVGKGVPDVALADRRSKFIEAFHNLLYGASRFFKEDSDTTVIADAFPLLNALKEVHLILAEGAHNQFGDLTWTARAEMLTIQWMLARREMKEFLRGRYMVPYQEPWMGAVDSMKKLQVWTDTTVTHFYELAVTGERILLSIRYGDWSDIENIEDQAKIWARYWKPDIQLYIHGYRAVTGVDLAAEVTDSRDAAIRYLQPSELLQRRLAEQRSAMPLRGPSGPDLVSARVSGQAALPRPGRPKLPAYRKEI